MKVPPFIINMPVLFERYVYCLLAERYGTRLIGYQEGCGDSIMDFTKKDEHMILDTKYITAWGLPSSRGERGGLDHGNARQLSGYARRTALRSKYLNPPTEDYICPCVVIYPSAEGLATLRDLPDRWLNADGTPTFPALQQVKEYQKFYKLPILLPVL